MVTMGTRKQSTCWPGIRHLGHYYYYYYYLVVALETQAANANAADCLTVNIKQIKRSDMLTL